jgi:hypothetical protein
MSLVKELQRLTQTNGEVLGRVVALVNSGVVVATASGQIEVSAKGDLRIGDLVTVDAGRAIKKQRNGDAQVFLI